MILLLKYCNNITTCYKIVVAHILRTREVSLTIIFGGNMTSLRSNRQFREISYYIKNSIKFYQIKNESFTPVIFCLNLFIMLATRYIPMPKSILPSSMNIIKFMIIQFFVSYILFIIATSYLYGYICDLKNQQYTLLESLKHGFFMSYRTFPASIFYIICVLTGSVFLIVPGILFYLKYYFYLCFMLDQNKSIKNAFFSSSFITNENKLLLFSIVFIVNVLVSLGCFVVLAFFINTRDYLIIDFISSFLFSIAAIIQQRLTALLYYDLVYA